MLTDICIVYVGYVSWHYKHFTAIAVWYKKGCLKEQRPYGRKGNNTGKRKQKRKRFCDKPLHKNTNHEKGLCIYEEGHKETACHCHQLEVEDSESSCQQDVFELEAQEI